MSVMALFVVFLFYFATVVTGQELRIIPEGTTFTKPLGSNIVFTCEIYRLGPQIVDVNLQWYDKDGREILDIAGPGRLMYIEKEENMPTKKLYFTHIRNEHAGTYSCSGVVGGNRQEKSIQLLLFQDITFLDARSPQHPILHTAAHIICRVTGQPVPTVSWRYRGAKITGGSSDRYVQDQSGLIIKNVTKEDDGLYYCRAEVDADGRYDDRIIDVIVHIPPKVTKKSDQIQGIQSQEVALMCRANGLPEPKYDFTKDGNLNPLFSTSRVFIDRDAGTIHFRPLHKEDEGTYRCLAFNNAGEDEAEINLRVLVPPTIVPIFNMTQQEGLSVTLVCSSTGDPPPDMAFRKAGNSEDYVLGNNENDRIVMSNPMSGRLELLVHNLAPDDTSNYTCKSRNSAGFHEKNGTITVLHKPRFPADQVKQVYIWPGKTRNITCRIQAEPLPVIDWYRFQFPLRNNETFRIYNMGKNSNLQVTAREYDVLWLFGKYTCKARNQYGEGEMQIDLLRAVLPAPPKSVVEVEKTSDRVILAAVPPDFNGGSEILGYRLEYEDKILTFAADQMILVENLRPSTTFLMRVRTLSEVGYGDPLSVQVKTYDVEPPSQIALKQGTADKTRYAIIWDKPISGGRPIREFEFRFREVDKNKNPVKEWKRRLKQVPEDTILMSHVLDGLVPGTYYELEVRARNDVGWSPVTQQFFETDADADNIYSSRAAMGPGIHLICVFVILALTFKRSGQGI